MRFGRRRKDDPSPPTTTDADAPAPAPADAPAPAAAPAAAPAGEQADAPVHEVSDASAELAAQLRQDLQGVVDRFGWAVLHGGGTGPGDPRFSHTVGLSRLDHPEVIVVGLPFEAGEKYLNLVGEAVRAGARFAPGAATTALTDEDSPVVFLQVTDTARLAVAEQFSGPVEVLQLVWPDSTGLLPWQEGHRNPPTAQPLLGPLPGE